MTFHLFRQDLAHFQAGFIDGGAVHDGVGTGKVDVLEDAGCEGLGSGTGLTQQFPLLGDQDGLSGRHIPDHLESQGLQGHTLRGHHPFGTAVLRALANHQGTDTVRVTEGQHAKTGNHGHHRVGPLAAAMHARDRLEYVGGSQAMPLHGTLQFVGQNVEQHLGVGTRVDVAQVLLEQAVLQKLGIGQVAVVAQDYAEGGVHIEGLGFGRAGGRPGSGITHMGNAYVAHQIAHVPGTEHIPHHAQVLVHVEHAAIHGDDAGCILTPVLQELQAVIKHLVDGLVRNNADDAAHG